MPEKADRTERIEVAAAEAAARKTLDALPAILGAARVAGLEQARRIQAQRLASARRQLALETLKRRSTKRGLAEAELRVKAREQALAQATAMRDAAAVMPVRAGKADAVLFGRVVNEDGTAAAGLAVTATGSSRAGIAGKTDSRGGFSLTVPPGQEFSLIVSGSGGAVLFREDGLKVDTGMTVYRLVSLGKPGGVPPADGLTMPDLVGQGLDAAQAIIRRIGLTVGKVADVETDKAADGTILATTPTAGANVKDGQSVDLQVARHPKTPDDQSVEVPKIIGRPLAEAEEALKRANLTLAKVSDVQTDKAPDGTVLACDPTEGVKVAAGTGVLLEVARKPAVPGGIRRDTPSRGVPYLERVVKAAQDDALGGALPVEPVKLMAALRKADVVDDGSLTTLLKREDADLKDLFAVGTVADTRKLRTRLRAAAKAIADG